MSVKSGGSGVASPPVAHQGQEAKQWSTFLSKCLRERVPIDRFQLFAKLLDRNTSGREICTALLQTQRPAKGDIAVGFDPLVASYANRLLSLGFVQGYELLAVLLLCSRVGGDAGAGGIEFDGEANGLMGSENGGYISWELEEALLNLLAMQFAAQGQAQSQGPLKSKVEAAKTLAAAADWMSAVVESDHRAMMQNMSGGFQTLGTDVVVLREAVGRLFVALAEHPRVVQVLDSSAPPDSAKKLADTLSAFIPLLSGVSIPLANRLDLFQRSHEVLQQQGPPGFDGSGTGNIDVGELQIGNIAERPVAHSRASMVVYLDALLSDLPKVNDGVFLAYLQVRFKGDVESSIIELISASFELLGMVSVRGDSSDKMFLYRTFIVNKVPLLISSLSRMAFMPPNMTLLISQAIGRLNSNGFPSYDSGFGVSGPNGSVLTETRREFLVACALHGHIGKENIKGFIGEETAPEPPASAKLTKEALLGEYQNNQKLEQLVNGLEGMDGNAGANAEAVVQTLHNLCSARDVMAVKSLCHLLSPKPHAIDTMFLFRSSISILSPLCHMLDEWKYEDDQGEYQPVYEEFSSCLFFLLACIRRFHLTIPDLGLQSENGFTAWVMDESLSAQPVKELNEEQAKQLAGWARGLFELEAISDDVMSICPPQDFYKLVPTIFTQSLLSRRLEAISVKAMENGIELLLEMFLLPCMVFGTHCLANQSWIRGGGSAEMLQFVQKLLRPSSKTGERLALHNTILAILRQDLQGILAELRLNEPSKLKDIDSLLEKLKLHESYTRSPHHTLKESGSWISSQGSNTLFELRNAFDGLCSWSMPSGLIPSIPAYSHQQTLFAIEVCGATRVIRMLIESLAVHAEAGMGDVALDVAASMVCAQDAVNHVATPSRSTISQTLRQALQIARDNASSTITKEPLKGEMTVLLHRQVETLLSSIPVDAGDLPGIDMQSMPMNMDPLNAAAMNLDMNLDMAQSMPVDMNMGVDMTMDMDMEMNMIGMDPLGLEQTQPDMSALAQQQQQQQQQQQHTTQALDFASAGGAVSAPSGAPDNTFPLAIDTSFGQDPDGSGGNEMDEDGRRTSVEDIWSGLGLDFT